MKKTSIWSLALVAFLGGFFAACSSDDEVENVDLNAFTIKPAKAPDFQIFSNGNLLSSSFGTRADVQVNGNYFKIQDWGGGKSDWMEQTYPVLFQYFDNAPAKTDRDEQVSTDEMNFVMDYIKNHPDEGGTTCNLTTYFIQNVGSSYDTYTLEFKNGESVHHTQSATGGNHMDYLQFGDVHINDYNASWGPRALCVDIPVVSPTYHESYANLTIEDAYKFYYIEYDGKTNCYLCFDYRTNKYDNGQCDFQGDGVYNDWVIKLSPADGSNAVDPSTVDPGTVDPGTVDTPDTPISIATDEVEVNLSVNNAKEKWDYIATKLSIHVRSITDVEVFIPVNAEYYCDADDMAIVLSHKLDPNYQYSNPGKNKIEGGYDYEYEVANQTVKITVKYEINGIRVVTDGINQEVIDYLKETYDDGITVEVWNYYKSSITRDALKPELDKSTIKFLDSDPGQYVNAFNKLLDYQKDDLAVYFTGGMPYVYQVTEVYDEVTGKLTDRTYTKTDPETPLDTKYYDTDAEGKFVKFIGSVNAWDCVVVPDADGWTAQPSTDNPTWDITDYNVIYKK